MAPRALSLAIYRSLLRFGHQLAGQGEYLYPRLSSFSYWGSYDLIANRDEAQKRNVKELLDGLDIKVIKFPVRTVHLTQHIKQAFKRSKESTEDVGALLDKGFKALRILQEQVYLGTCSSVRTTDAVEIEVTSKYNKEAINMFGQKEFVFTYRVRITNLRKKQIQVLGREWQIKDARGETVAQVDLHPGNGIVGQQPIIPAGSCFEYYSGTGIPTSQGSMNGSFLVLCFSTTRKEIKGSNLLLAAVEKFPLRIPTAKALQ